MCALWPILLYYKPMTIVNDDSRVINMLEASLTDNARVFIYDRHMFIVQATDNIYKHKHISFGKTWTTLSKLGPFCEYKFLWAYLN